MAEKEGLPFSVQLARPSADTWCPAARILFVYVCLHCRAGGGRHGRMGNGERGLARRNWQLVGTSNSKHAGLLATCAELKKLRGPFAEDNVRATSFASLSVFVFVLII